MIFSENCIKWMASDEWAGEDASSPLIAYPSLPAYHITSTEQIILSLHLQSLQEILPPNEYSYEFQGSLGHLCICSCEDSIAQKHLCKFFFGPNFRVSGNHIHVWGPILIFSGLMLMAVHCLCSITCHPTTVAYFSFGKVPLPHFMLSLKKLLHLGWPVREVPFPGHSDSVMAKAVSTARITQR